MIRYNRREDVYYETQTKQSGRSVNELRANIKRMDLNIPAHDYLSNRYVMKKIDGW